MFKIIHNVYMGDGAFQTWLQTSADSVIIGFWPGKELL